MAFPSNGRKTDDAYFLKPYSPNEFAHNQVRVDRKPESGFLFRIDSLPGNRVVILVQSAISPDWDYAFKNAEFLLDAPAQVNPFKPEFLKNQTLRFKLLANATRKIDTKSGPDGKRRHGKRVPVDNDKLVHWLNSKAQSAGFTLVDNSVVVQSGYVYVNKKGNDKWSRMFSASFNGILNISDPDVFRDTIIRGIGPAKAFGFGLLSVASANQSSLRREHES